MTCPGCGDPITPRYEEHGVCRNCYGTTDDPNTEPMSEPPDLEPINAVLAERRAAISLLPSLETPVLDAAEVLLAEVQRLRDEVTDRANVEADLRAQLAEAKAWGYLHYTSTYCIHDLHDQCRQQCKVCEHPCLCDCHKDEP